MWVHVVYPYVLVTVPFGVALQRTALLVPVLRGSRAKVIDISPWHTKGATRNGRC